MRRMTERMWDAVFIAACIVLVVSVLLTGFVVHVDDNGNALSTANSHNRQIRIPAKLFKSDPGD